MQDPESMAAIARLYRRMAAAAVAGDAQSYATCYAQDGVLLPPHHGPIQGRAQVQAWAEELFGTWTMKGHTVSMDDQRIGSTVAYSRYRGIGTFAPNAGGDEVPYQLKYVDTLVRQPDGSWLISCHMWNSSIPGSSVWTR
jgi:uncharacterized protein (TIGR02246 family)